MKALESTRIPVMPRLPQLFCLFVFITLTACASIQQPPSTSQSNALQHIVVIWLKEPGNEKHRQQLLEASQRLTEIPGILSVRGGTVISSNRSVVDSSFDIALIMEMSDRDVLKRYAQHPLHQQLLKEIFKPLIEHYRVFDIE